MCLCNSLLQLCLQTPAHHLPIIANLCHPACHLPTSANLCQHTGIQLKQNYYSTLFCQKKNALEAVNNQKKLLMATQESPKEYVDVVSSTRMEGEEIDEDMSEHQRWIVQQKIIVLTLALIQAEDKMESLKNWDACCESAVNQAKLLGMKTAKCSCTVRNWYQEFQKERNMKVKILPEKHNMPPFLQQNQDVTVSNKQYLCEHLHELSEELLCEYIHETVLPKMIRESTGAVPTDEVYINDVKLLLGKYGLKTISVSTVCWWMKCLGFKCAVRKKGYYVHGHEKPGTIEYRKHYVSRYLTYEPRAHCWIQIDAKESTAIENKGCDKSLDLLGSDPNIERE
jgi:hypothetical protein